MKVFCINDSGWECLKRFFVFWKKWKDSTGPDYGDVCTIVGEESDENGDYWILKEWPHDEDSFAKECFIPIEEAEREEELVRVEDIHLFKPWPVDKKIMHL